MLHFIQLSAVHGVLGSFRHVAVRHIGNLLAPGVDAVLVNDHARIVSGRPRNLQGIRGHAGKTLQVFGQLHIQGAFAVRHHADIIVGEFRRIGDAALHIQLVVQLQGDGVANVAAIDHTVFHGSYLVLAGAVLVYDTGYAVLTVHTVFAFDAILRHIIPGRYADIDLRCVLAVLPVDAVCARRPDQADHTGLPVLAGFALFTHNHAVGS